MDNLKIFSTIASNLINSCSVCNGHSEDKFPILSFSQDKEWKNLIIYYYDVPKEYRQYLKFHFSLEENIGILKYHLLQQDSNIKNLLRIAANKNANILIFPKNKCGIDGLATYNCSILNYALLNIVKQTMPNYKIIQITDDNNPDKNRLLVIGEHKIIHTSIITDDIEGALRFE